MEQLAKEVCGVLGDAELVWFQFWIAQAAAITLGMIIGYLWREKRLWDHKKGPHKKKYGTSHTRHMGE